MPNTCLLLVQAYRPLSDAAPCLQAGGNLQDLPECTFISESSLAVLCHNSHIMTAVNPLADTGWVSHIGDAVLPDNRAFKGAVTMSRDA